jgi:hypothetical protein
MATPSTAILNSSTFEPLISKLATVLELSQRPEGVTSTQSKQAVLAAVGAWFLNKLGLCSPFGICLLQSDT